MDKHQLSPLDLLLNTYNYQTFGILWLTQEPFSPKLKFFSGVDHLMNGVLAQSFLDFRDKDKRDQEQDNVNLFSSSFYERSIYTAHIPVPSWSSQSGLSSLVPKLVDVLTLMVKSTPHSQAVNQVIILSELQGLEGSNDVAQPITKKLKEKFPQLEFLICKS